MWLFYKWSLNKRKYCFQYWKGRRIHKISYQEYPYKVFSQVNVLTWPRFKMLPPTQYGAHEDMNINWSLKHDLDLFALFSLHNESFSSNRLVLSHAFNINFRISGNEMPKAFQEFPVTRHLSHDQWRCTWTGTSDTFDFGLLHLTFSSRLSSFFHYFPPPPYSTSLPFLFTHKSMLMVSKIYVYEKLYPKSFRTGRLERELQMVQLSATRCSYIAILWVSLVSFAAITLSCCFSTSGHCCKRIFRYLLSPETFGYSLVCLTKWQMFIQIQRCKL
jgi:hypothetical protein